MASLWQKTKPIPFRLRVQGSKQKAGNPKPESQLYDFLAKPSEKNLMLYVGKIKP